MKESSNTALLLAFIFLITGCGKTFVERSQEVYKGMGEKQVRSKLGHVTFGSPTFAAYRTGSFLTVIQFKEGKLKEKKTGYIKDIAAFERHRSRHQKNTFLRKLARANSAKYIFLAQKLNWDIDQIMDYSAFKVIRTAFSPNENYDPSKKMFFRPWGYPYEYVHPKYGDKVWNMLAQTIP